MPDHGCWGRVLSAMLVAAGLGVVVAVAGPARVDGPNEPASPNQPASPNEPAPANEPAAPNEPAPATHEAPQNQPAPAPSEPEPGPNAPPPPPPGESAPAAPAAPPPDAPNVPPDAPAAQRAAPSTATVAPDVPAAPAESEPPARAQLDHRAPADILLPPIRFPWVAWVAAALVLALTVQTRPLLTVRNLDALVLAAMSLALLGRNSGVVLGGDGAGGFTLQWWTYLLLTVFGLYWVVRGLVVALRPGLSALVPNMNERGLAVFVVAGIALVVGYVLTAPLSPGARDAVVGGLYTAETGKLPYGDAIGHDSRSPWLYLAMAGASRVLPPAHNGGIDPDDLAPMRWSNRDIWMRGSWDTEGDMRAARGVSLLLFALTLAAIYVLGRGLHSRAMGLALAAIVCVFPGALECFARPEISLPAMLLAWSMAALTLPLFGGFLSMLLIVLAGLAWPWAWLVGLVLLAYWVSRGWHAVGAVLGTLAGLAGVGALLLFLVEPSLPRADGAVRAAGMTPAYTARLSDDDALVIERLQGDQQVSADFKSGLWRFLLNRDTSTLGQTGLQAALPSGVIADQVTFQQLDARGEARPRVQAAYRARLAEQDELTRLRANTRTIIEAAWVPQPPRVAAHTGAWELWADTHPQLEGRWTWIRRAGKILVGLLAVLAAVLAFRAAPRERHRAIGGALAVSAAILLVSPGGGAGDMLWLMPGILALLAATTEPVVGVVVGAGAAPSPTGGFVGDGPRITVNK